MLAATAGEGAGRVAGGRMLIDKLDALSGSFARGVLHPAAGRLSACHFNNHVSPVWISRIYPSVAACDILNIFVMLQVVRPSVWGTDHRSTNLRRRLCRIALRAPHPMATHETQT